MTRTQSHAVKHDIMESLCHSSVQAHELAHVLISLYEDREQDIVIRDYAIQHIGVSLYERSPSSVRDQIRQVCMDALQETDSSIAGTALLALSRLSRNDSTLGQQVIRQIALDLAADDGCGELTRITAVQICGQMKVMEVIPLAHHLAAQSECFPLKMAALATLKGLNIQDGAEEGTQTGSLITTPCFDCN